MRLKMTIRDLLIFVANAACKNVLSRDASDAHKVLLAINYVASKLNLSRRIVETWSDLNIISRDHRVNFYKIMREFGHSVKLSELNSLTPKKRVKYHD